MKQKNSRFLKKYLDWWSIPHFLFGVVMALGALVFVWPLHFAFVLTLCIAILWENFERRIRLHETRLNAKIDVLLPLIAFGFTIFLMNRMPTQEREDQQVFFFVAIFLYFFINFIAWRAKMENDREFQG